MTVRALYVAGINYSVTGEGYGPDGEVRFEDRKAEGPHLGPLRELATILLGCNNAHLLIGKDGTWKTVGDPTEGALLAAGAKAGGDRKRIEKELPKQHEFPFDSDRKRSSVIRRMPDGKLRAFINGAPGPLLDRCTHLYTREGVRPLTAPDRERILAQNSVMATASPARARFGLARPEQRSARRHDRRSVELDLVFVGLTGMYDPPRPEAKDAIAKCHAAGIRVVMITGDQPDTAMAIAREIGLASTDEVAIAGVELDNTVRRCTPQTRR